MTGGSLGSRFQFDVYTTLRLADSLIATDDVDTQVVRARTIGASGALIFASLSAPDPWALAARVLSDSRGPKLVPLVAVSPDYMPPHTLAKLARDTSLLFDSRVDLNLITGATPTDRSAICSPELDHRARYERLTEYAAVLRTAWSLSTVTFNGTYYQYQNAKVACCLPESSQPRLFVAGASADSRAVASSANAIHLTHPAPAAEYGEWAREWLDGTDIESVAVRVGIVARSSRAAARAAVSTLFPVSRSSTRTALEKRLSESVWSAAMARRISEVDSAGYIDEVYCLAAFQSGVESMPLIVGTYADVGRYVAEYLAPGLARTLVLGSIQSDEEAKHTAEAVANVRMALGECP